jgi:hypothetical protein
MHIDRYVLVPLDLITFADYTWAFLSHAWEKITTP